MALIRIDHVPETVKVNLPLNIILPDPGEMQGVPVRERKVLYLLHGLSDDASAWQRYSMHRDRCPGLRAGGGDALGGAQLLHRPAQRAALLSPTWWRNCRATWRMCLASSPKRENTLHRGALDGRLRRIQGGPAAPGALLRRRPAFSGVLSLDILQTPSG